MLGLLLCTSSWNVEVETDPMTDQTNVYASVPSKETNRYGKHGRLYTEVVAT